MLTIKFFEKESKKDNPVVCSTAAFDDYMCRLNTIKKKKLITVKRDYVILSRYFVKIRKTNLDISKYIQDYIQNNREVFFYDN